MRTQAQGIRTLSIDLLGSLSGWIAGILHLGLLESSEVKDLQETHVMVVFWLMLLWPHSRLVPKTKILLVAPAYTMILCKEATLKVCTCFSDHVRGMWKVWKGKKVN